ncbi:MAG: acyl-CoA dehydrogenase family protein, partial [Acidimicrobiales bacterium]|nr:acyl-CoA dehydrogenase family protein [Acidimicrobiales bacterium]
MDLNLSPRHIDFRDECRTWLAEHHPGRIASMDTPEGFEEHREWERVLFDAGWSVPAWPAAYGGRDCDLIEWLIYEEEYWLSGVPGRVSANGVSLLAPTIFNFGTQEQQDYFLPRMASGEHIWAQGWSEPEAGSDLAGIKTKAILDGDDYVLNGQKTWCSRGAFADWIFCIVRTDPDAERHAGLTYLLVPADTPGMERRPIGRLDGEPGFAELFFDDARVSAEHVLGEVGQGWAVAMAAAGSERGLSLRSPGRFMAAAERLNRLVREIRSGGRRVDPRLRDEVTDAWIKAQAYRWQTYQMAADLMDGAEIGPEASEGKVFWSELDLELHATALRLLGEAGEVVGASPDA